MLRISSLLACLVFSGLAYAQTQQQTDVEVIEVPILKPQPRDQDEPPRADEGVYSGSPRESQEVDLPHAPIHPSDPTRIER